MRPSPGQRYGRPALIAVLVSLATAFGMITPVVAYAHGKLKSSAPAAGARLSTAPRELRLTFTEAPELAITTVELRGPNDATVALAPIELAADGLTVSARIRGGVAPGAYRVSWKMAGADGHPVRGRFAFTIDSVASAATPARGREADTVVLPSPRNGQPASGVPAAEPDTPSGEHRMTGATRDDNNEFGSESPAYVAIRWAQFVSLLLVLGALSFRFVVLRFLRRVPQQGPGSLDPLASQCRVRVAMVGLLAAVTLAVVAFLRAYAQSYAMHGRADALNLALIETLIGRTLWGWGWLIQVAGVAMTILGFWLARRAEATGHEQRRATLGWTVAALGGIALAFTPALSGHSASAPSLRSLAVLGDAVHVAGAAGWLGSLACVVIAGIPAALSLPDGERGEAVADLVNAFSPVGLAFAVLAAITGAFAAWLQLGGIAALWQEAYGRILLLKLVVLSFVAATGAYNWLRVKPTLGDIEGAQRVRRSALTELVIALVVLLITAVLVATPPPGEVMGISAG